MLMDFLMTYLSLIIHQLLFPTLKRPPLQFLYSQFSTLSAEHTRSTSSAFPQRRGT